MKSEGAHSFPHDGPVIAAGGVAAVVTGSTFSVDAGASEGFSA